MVEVTGIEPATSWSQTTRATNCATPRSYNLSIIIHKRCGRQVPARQKSYSQAEQPQHQQVRGVEGIEEPLVKRAPAGGAPAIVQVQDHKRGDKDRHSAADGLPHLPAAQPGHAAVEQRRRAERGFLPRSVPPGPGKQQCEHRGQQRPVTEQRCADQQHDADAAQHAVPNLLLHQQHQKAEQQREQHVELHKPGDAVCRKGQLIRQLRQHGKPQQPPGVAAFGAGAAVAFDEKKAHRHGGKVADAEAQICQRLPGGQKDVRNVVDKHGEHGNHLDGITGHGKNPFRIHCKVRGSGRQDCSGTATFLRPALSFALCLRYNEVQGSYRDRENNTALPQGVLRGNAGLFPVPVICCMLVFMIELFV